MLFFFSKIVRLLQTFAFVFLLANAAFCFAQTKDSIRIEGQLLNNTRFPKVVVQQFGVGIYDIAALPVDKETGRFSIVAPPDVRPGIYRFRYSQTGFGDYVDVIINGTDKEINFAIDVSQEPEQRLPVFTTSEENKALYAFTKQQKEALYAIEVKQEFLSNYPHKSDKTYQKILKDFEKSKHAYNKYRQEFITKTPFYWTKSKAMFQKIYFPNPLDHPRIQVFKAHEEFWEGKPTTDSLLLNTPLYTDAILNYLQYYMNPEMEFGTEEQNHGFIKCVDNIMEVFSPNEKTKEFAIKYLQVGFKEIGNEILLQYTDEQYAATAQCTNDDEALKNRLERYNALKPGNLAPAISLIGQDGKEKTLFDFEQKEIVLVFWASWCPHCMQEMPKLQEWAKANPEVLVLAISLDEDYTAFQEGAQQFPNLLHHCDLQKWESKIVKSYFVVATPTLFVLDEERKLVAKYSRVSNFIKP